VGSWMRRATRFRTDAQGRPLSPEAHVAMLNAFCWSTQTIVAVEGLCRLFSAAHTFAKRRTGFENLELMVSATKDRRGTVSLCMSAGRM